MINTAPNRTCENHIIRLDSRPARTLVSIKGGKADFPPSAHAPHINPDEYRERSELTRWKLSIATHGVTWFSHHCVMFGEDDLSTEIGIAAARARLARPDMKLAGSTLTITRTPAP